MLASLYVLPTMSKQLNVKLSSKAAGRLDRLQRKLGKSQAAIVDEALTHLLGTVARDQAVWLTVPGELEEMPEPEEEDDDA